MRSLNREITRARAEPRRIPAVLRRLVVMEGAEAGRIESLLAALDRGEEGSTAKALAFIDSIVPRRQANRPGLGEDDALQVEDHLRWQLLNEDDPKKRRALAAKIRRRLEALRNTPAMASQATAASKRPPRPPTDDGLGSEAAATNELRRILKRARASGLATV
jgi:hypothetical protein